MITIALIAERMTNEFISAIRDQRALDPVEEEELLAYYRSKILRAATFMYESFNEEGTLDELEGPEADWFSEFLYEEEEIVLDY
jgi:hypothetical protein